MRDFAVDGLDATWAGRAVRSQGVSSADMEYLQHTRRCLRFYGVGTTSAFPWANVEGGADNGFDDHVQVRETWPTASYSGRRLQKLSDGERLDHSSLAHRQIVPRRRQDHMYQE